MADKHIGNLRAENPVPNGIINPTDLLEVFRPNNESNPAQGGVSLGGTLQQIANFTLGNIKVVNNANGVSFRFPQARIQACFHRLEAVHIGSGAYLRIDDWEYPQAFAEVPEPLLQMNNNGSSYTPLPQNLRPPIVWNGESASRMGNARIYADGGGFGSSDVIKVGAIAVGRY